MILHHHTWTPWKTTADAIVRASDATWKKPAKWQREAEKAGERRRVLVGVDAFEDYLEMILDKDGHSVYEHEGKWVRFLEDGHDPRPGESGIGMNTARKRLFAAIDANPNLDFIVRTDYPENIGKMLPMRECEEKPIFPGAPGRPGRPLPCYKKSHPNLWLGCNITTQQSANDRLPHLLACRDLSPCLFAWWEPQGAVDFTRLDNGCDETYNALTAEVRKYSGHTFRTSDTSPLDWLIISGGEQSVHPDWVRDAVAQCRAAGVAVWFESWGSWQNGSAKMHNAALLNNGTLIYPDTREAREQADRDLGGSWYKFNPMAVARVGRKHSGRLLDGVEVCELPEVTL